MFTSDTTPGTGDVTVEELKSRLDGDDSVLLVDVREQREFEICRIPGSVLIPLGELPARMSELDGHADMVVHCKSGARSAKAVAILRDAGYTHARNLQGGILAWIDRVDPTLPKY